MTLNESLSQQESKRKKDNEIEPHSSADIILARYKNPLVEKHLVPECA